MMSISKHEFNDADVIDAMMFNGGVHIEMSECNSQVSFTKADIIAMAKAVNLTAHDIECTEYKALCADLNQVDEDHFDELVEIQANKIKINKSIN